MSRLQARSLQLALRAAEPPEMSRLQAQASSLRYIGECDLVPYSFGHFRVVPFSTPGLIVLSPIPTISGISSNGRHALASAASH